MIKKRCFLCSAKMADNGLCTNAGCVRSEPVAGSENETKPSEETQKKQA